MANELKTIRVDGTDLSLADTTARDSIETLRANLSSLQTTVNNKQDRLTIDTAMSSSSSNPVQNKVIQAAIDEKQDVLSFDSAPTRSSTNPVTSGGVYTAIQNVTVKTDATPTQGSTNPVASGGVYTAIQNVKVTTDSTPVQGSTNPITSGGVYTALQDVQVTTDASPTQGSDNPVTSGGVYSAIQTINSSISALTPDEALSSTSTKPIQNKAVDAAIKGIKNTDSQPTQGSTKFLTSGAIYTALQNLEVDIDVDAALSTTSTNPVQNKVINSAINTINNRINDIESSSSEIDPASIEKVTTIDKTSSEVVIKQKVNGNTVVQSVATDTVFDTFGARNLNYENNQLTLVDGDGAQIGDAVTITGGGGGPAAASKMVITNRLPSVSFTILDTDKTAVILYNITSVDTDTQEATGPITCTWYVNNIRVMAQSVRQGDNSFDARSYLTDGTSNTVKLIAEDANGTTKTKQWYIDVNMYSVSWNVSDFEVYGTSGLTLRVTPSGSGTKELNVTLDGVSIYKNNVSTSGRAITISIPAQTHGAHTIEAWLEVDIDGETFTTDKITHVGIWETAGNNTPILAVLNESIEAEQHSTTSIKWMAYNPSSESMSVQRLVGSDVDATVVADRTVQTWAYKVTSSTNVTLTLKAGNVTKTVTVIVTPSSITVRPVTENLVLDLDPSGHSNSELNLTSFGYKDVNGNNHPLTFSNKFDWSNGGFQVDSDGVTAFVIKKGSYVTFDTSLFADNAGSTGKEIKIIFKVDNVRNYDAEFARCLADGVGLVMQAQTATVTSELSTLNAYYCEGEKIEMDINIHQSSATAYSTIWLEGKPSCAKQYTTMDNWRQTTPSNLVIGSEECDVWIYRIKMYGNDLTRFEVMDNFIADCADPTEMVERYTRNNIFNDSGIIDRNLLAAASPNLRIIHATIPRMTTSKEDSVTVNISHSLMNGGVTDNWTANDVIMKAQGTSSLEYGLAALNLDIDLSGASSWVDSNGQPMTSYSMTDQSIGVSYFNLKLNVASSENANNVLLADDYNEFNPCRVQARVNNSKVRDTVEGHPCAIFLTNSSSSSITIGARTVEPGATVFYGSGDMNNSKKNNAVFGQDSSQWSKQCCIEISNNNNDQCRFLSDDLSAEDYSGKGSSNFEFRYPKKPTNEMKELHQEVLSWVVSTNRKTATNAQLPSSVTYNGTRYTIDTVAYRAAKFRAEVENFFSLKSLLFHYLFTERHLMVDNRAKNTFMSYEFDPDYDDYRWNFCKDYDNDTAEGNDNSGGLTFTYGLEDTDKIGDSDVFNAADSVLWVNIRDLFANELAQMYVDLESSGAWSSQRLLQKYKDYQGARPEALVAEDMYNKYLLPYINSSETRYLNMLLGDKDDQRRQFETYQEAYIASKYSGSFASADRISLRTNTSAADSVVPASGDMTIIPYCDLYVCVQYGNAGTVKTRAKRGQAVNIVCPASTLNDTETYIYSSSWLREVGDLSATYTKLAELARAVKLLKLQLGNSTVGYSNRGMTSLSFGNNIMLKYVDIQGLTNLSSALDLTALISLEEIYASGSGVTGITLPEGAPLRIAYLPAIRSLTAKNIDTIEQFAVSTVNMTSIWVENCPGIDTASIINNATKIAKGRLINVNWDINNLDGILRLVGKSGYTAIGGDADRFILTGNVNVAEATQDELNIVRSEFPDLVVTCDSIVEPIQVTFYDYDNATVLYSENVRPGNDAVDPVEAGIIPEPTRASTVDTVYSYIGWSGSLKNITTRTNVYATFAESERMYRVRFWNESILVQDSTVAARDSVSYVGADLKSNDHPEGIWMGFNTNQDASAAGDMSILDSVTQDINMYAIYAIPTLPPKRTSGYTYLYSDNPNADSAYTFGEFIGIIRNGRAKDYFSIGDKVEIVRTDFSTYGDDTIVLQIEAFNHYRTDDGGSMSPVVFGMVGVMNEYRSINDTSTNSGGYQSMGIRSYLNTTVFNGLPKNWKSVIQPVEVLSTAGQMRTTIVKSIDKLFLRSAVELGLAADIPYTNEIDSEADQKQFPIYTTFDSLYKSQYNGAGGARVVYWTRSPYVQNNSSFVTYRYSSSLVDTSSSNTLAPGWGTSDQGPGVSFCFCIGTGATGSSGQG